MAYVPKEFLQQLLSRIDLVQLIGMYCDLKPAGDKYSCCCPFHQEKTPSFYVLADHKHFKCFGCNAYGDAIDFLVKYKNLSFLEAVKELASYAGMQLPQEFTEGTEEQKQRAQMVAAPQDYYAFIERVCSFFSAQLMSNAPALNYLRQYRQLCPELINDFRLGYAPDDFDYIFSLCRNATEIKMALELGLLKARKGQEQQPNPQTYAFFRDRIMIPLRDRQGRVIGFGARRVKDDPRVAKYINSPESPIFRKRQELYGLYECLQFNHNRPDSIIVVEGYLDALSLYQAGFTNVVAALGTALTSEHIKLMQRYTKSIVLCFDGDQAGRDATWKALQVATPVVDPDCGVSVVYLPESFDPDTLLRTYGLSVMEHYLGARLSYVESIVHHESIRYDCSDPTQRVMFISAVLPMIKAMTLPMNRSVALYIVSAYLQMEMPRLQELLNMTEPDPAFCAHEHLDYQQ